MKKAGKTDMNYKVGFIGSGNIATAIISGVIKSGYLKPKEICISDLDKVKTAELESEYGVVAVDSNADAVKNSDVIVLSIKPHIYAPVLQGIKDYVTDDKSFVTIAAGISIDYVKKQLDRNVRVVRVMPNTPVLVGEGMTAITSAPPAKDSDVEFVKGMFSSCGLVEMIKDESLLDAVTALSSSSPAFIDMLIEAMADASVLLGLPRKKSYTMAAQAVRGAAKMIIDTGKHPGELKDMVCSPAGTTIEGVRVLEEKGIRNAIFEAVIATGEKAKIMGEKYK